jgi:hypothetical protein
MYIRLNKPAEEITGVRFKKLNETLTQFDEMCSFKKQKMLTWHEIMTRRNEKKALHKRDGHGRKMLGYGGLEIFYKILIHTFSVFYPPFRF